MSATPQQAWTALITILTASTAAGQTLSYIKGVYEGVRDGITKFPVLIVEPLSEPEAVGGLSGQTDVKLNVSIVGMIKVLAKDNQIVGRTITELIGNTSVGSLSKSLASASRRGNVFTFTKDCSVSTIKAYCRSQMLSGNLPAKVEIYSYDTVNEEPLTLLGTSDNLTPTTDFEWNEFTFSSPVSIQKDTKYYLCIAPVGSGIGIDIKYDDDSGSEGFRYEGMWTPETYKYSIYAECDSYANGIMDLKNDLAKVLSADPTLGSVVTDTIINSVDYDWRDYPHRSFTMDIEIEYRQNTKTRA